jgi:hypothetical protein
MIVEPLEPRLVPSVVYEGGPQLNHVEIVNVVSGPQPVNVAEVSNVVAGPYLSLLTPSYGVGRGEVRATVEVPELSVTTDAGIRGWLGSQIGAGVLPRPDSQTLYVVWLAPGQSSDVPDAVGYHNAFALSGQSIPYAVILPGDADQEAQVDAHEVAESVTDPVPLTGWVNPSLGVEGEIADPLMWLATFSLDGYTFSACVSPTGQPITPQTVVFSELMQLRMDLAVLELTPSLPQVARVQQDWDALVQRIDEIL